MNKVLLLDEGIVNVDKIAISIEYQVFLDPPFHKNLVEKTIFLLEASQLLDPHALLYIEAEAALEELPLSETWKIIRSKKSGSLGYHLVMKN